MSDVVVIETIEKDGSEWGLSFSGSNPEQDDYFKMVSEEEAFRLRDRPR